MVLSNFENSEKWLETVKDISLDAMTAEYWPIKVILATDCWQNLHLHQYEVVKLCGLWLVEKDMMADRQKIE